MAKLNMASIKKKLNSAKKTELKIEKTVNKIFNESKIQFIEDFNEHPVTKEIEQGPKGSNISSTLGGVGNLFSFIGFDKTSNPTSEVRAFLLQNFKLSRPKKIQKADKASFEYTIRYPGLEDLKKISPMPWEGGRSWVSAIERGISGFSNYMYKKFVEGRSGEGLQTDNKVRGSNYKPTKYMSEIIADFVKNLRTIK